MAKTTNVINSTLMAWYLGTDGSETKIAHTTDASLSISHATRDITSKDSPGWRYLLEGLRQASGSASFYFVSDHASGYTAQDFYDIVINSRNTIHAIFKTSNTDDTSWEGDVYVTSIEISSGGSEDNVTVSCSFEFTGPITMLNT